MSFKKSEINFNMAKPEVMEQLVCGSNVLTEEEYRDLVLAISEYACSIVTKTLGPYGKTTNVDDSTFTAPTKDGWTVLRSLRFNDPLYNSIYNVINQISFDLVTKVGDGTTSALTGANVFMHAILNAIKDENSVLYGMRQQDLLSKIESVKDTIVETLRASEDIHNITDENNYDEVFRIARISANGNDDLARIIQDIYQKTNNPNIYVTLDAGDTITSQIQDGYKLDCGVMNQKVYRNSDDGDYKIDTPIKVAVFNHNVTYNEHKNIISELSKYATEHNTYVLILAPYFDDIMTNILNTTINSYVQQRKVPTIILAQVPLSTEVDRNMLTDFLMLTNGQLFDYGKVRAVNVTLHNADPKNAKNKIEDDLLDIQQYHFESVYDLVDSCVGTINRASIGEKYVVISNYETVYNEELYKKHVEEVSASFKEIARRTNKSSNILTKDYLYAQQRYIKLLGKMGTIKVGGQTELEKHCMKDWVDDAVLACRSAMNNGYIRGLNLTTISTIRKLMSGMTNNGGEIDKENMVDIEILSLFESVFREMSMMVLENKYPKNHTGEEEKYVVYGPDDVYDNGVVEVTNSEVIEECFEKGFSFNLVTNTLEQDWSVINSLATDVEILNSVVGVLSILLTSNQYISLNKSYDRKMSRRIQNEMKQEESKVMELGRLEARLQFINNHPDIDPKTLTMIFQGFYEEY